MTGDLRVLATARRSAKSRARRSAWTEVLVAFACLLLLSVLQGDRAQLSAQSSAAPPESADSSVAEDPAAHPRAFVAAELVRIHPRGEFAEYALPVTAVGAHLRYRWVSTGHLWLRAEAAFTPYQTEGVIRETHRTLGYLAVGPQLMLATGRFRPHGSFSLGVLYHSTISETIFRPETRSATGLLVSFGAGLDVFVRQGDRPISLSASVRSRTGGETDSVEFIEGELHSPAYTPDMITYQAGVSVWLGAGD